MRWLTLFTLAIPYLCAATLPVWIEPNHGQFGADIDFAARSGSWQAGLRGNAVVLVSGDGERVQMRFDGSRPLRAAEPEGKALPGLSSYFRGNDPSKWITGVPHFARVRYRDVYPGIDLIYYGSPEGKLEYDFELSPSADARAIRLSFDGVAHLKRTASGDLRISTASGKQIVQRAPRVFEERNGMRREVASHYRLDGAASARFEIARREWTDAKLIVDPVLEYSTFAGGGAFDAARALACDALDNCYMAGEGRSRNGLVGPLQSSGNGGQEVVVVRVNHQTNMLGYYVVIGGDMDETANAIVLDAAGSVYIAGTTKSLNFPTRNAAQPNPGSPLFSDAFVAKLSADGTSLLYSTYVGGAGTEEGRGLAVDRTGAAYLVGSTGSRESFPLTTGALQGSFRGSVLQQSATGFVTKIHPTGSRWVYSTLFGGSRQDEVRGIVVDESGQAVIIGTTTSLDFPVRSAWQPLLASAVSGFIARLNPEGSQTIFATYIGGPAINSLDAIIFDNTGNIVIGGSTSTTGFPIKNGVQSTYGGGRSDGFVAKFAGSGSDLLWSTYIGGSDSDGVSAIILHRDGSLSCAGYTASANFPIRFSAQQGGGKIDAFVVRYTSNGETLISSTLLGGAEDDRALALAVDGNDNAMVAGWTASRDFPFPRLGGGIQMAFGGGSGDMFLSRLAADSPYLTASPVLLQTSSSVASFTATVGALRPPNAVTLQITSAAAGLGFTVEWSVNGAGNWLSAGPQRGETPTTINVFANPATLLPGSYVGVVRLVPLSGGLPTLVNVNFQVLNPPAEIFSLSPAWVPAGSGDVEVTLRGKGFGQSATVRMVSEDASGTVLITPASITPNTLVIQVPRSSLFRDSSFEIRINHPDAEPSNPVSLLVGGRTARVLPATVVSAASGGNGPIAPGQMLLVQGQGMGPAELMRPDINNGVIGSRAAGVRVLVDGIAAPLLFVSDRQICVVAPYSIAQSSTVELTVEYNGERSMPLVLQTAATQPGILTPDSYVYGYGTIVNEGGADNAPANAARRGSVLTFYATGTGLLAIPVTDGRISSGTPAGGPIAPVSVLIDGRDAEVLGVVEAPSQVSGIVQVKVRVPQGVRSGDVALAIRAGDVMSPAVRMFVE